MVYFGWDYKREHSLTSATELTDYQVKIRVYRSEGTSTGDTVYLGSKCLADYGDIRFVASDDTTELPYWMETNAGTYADFWVKVGSITSDSCIYIYYGNSSATTTSNGDTTFIFFDDFAGDLSKWTSAGTPTISGGILTLNTTSGTPSEGIASISTFGTNYAIRARVNIPSALYGGIGFGTGIGGVPMVDVQYQINGTNNVWLRNNNGTNTYSTALGNSGAYHIWDIRRNSSTNTSVSIDGATPVINSGSIPTGSLNCAIWIYYTASNPTLYTDWILVRQYTATEPTQGAWSEEILNESYADFESLYNVGEFVSFVSLYFVGELVDFSSKYNIEWLVDFVLKYRIEIETAFESIYKIKTDHNFTTCITSNDKKSAEFRTRVESVRSSAIRFEMT